MDFSTLLTPEVTQTILGIVSAALIYVIQKASKYLKSKTNNENFDAALNIMDRLLTTSVKQIEQTFKKDLLKESSTGKLSPIQKQELGQHAIDTVMVNLSESIKKEIEKKIPDIHRYALNKVEDIVHDIKAPQGAEANIISVIDNAVKRGTIKSISRMAQNSFGLNNK